MTGEKEKTNVLGVCVGRTQNLIELIEYSKNSIVSKTVLDKPAGTITLFAFDEGQKLSEHTTPYDAVVQVLDGRANVTIGCKDVEALAGQIIIMSGNVPHAVFAKEKFKMLLTMVR